ncbi:hypothetical protein PTKIN_Ptkin11bG0184000 [Pterospermum kingtungense]
MGKFTRKKLTNGVCSHGVHLIYSTSASLTISSSSNSVSFANRAAANNAGDSGEPGVVGVPNHFLGITPAYLWQIQLQWVLFTNDVLASVNMADFQVALSREIDAWLKSKCDKLAGSFVDILVISCILCLSLIYSSSGSQISSSRLPERVKLIIEEIERDEVALREDLYSADRKFAEYYNVGELGNSLRVHIYFCSRIVSGYWSMFSYLKLIHKNRYQHFIKLRKYLVGATEEASVAYNKAVTRMREYQGVDPDHFDNIARQYHDVMKKLENRQSTIHQVEMDLKRLPDHAST